MKIWGCLAAMCTIVGADEAFRGERGPKECQKVKLTDSTGLKWHCSSRTRTANGKQRNKKCRGESLILKFRFRDKKNIPLTILFNSKMYHKAKYLTRSKEDSMQTAYWMGRKRHTYAL